MCRSQFQHFFFRKHSDDNKTEPQVIFSIKTHTGYEKNSNLHCKVRNAKNRGGNNRIDRELENFQKNKRSHVT